MPPTTKSGGIRKKYWRVGMPTSINSLQKDALEIRRLNRLIVKAVAESDLPSLQEILPKYAETKKRI